MSGVRPSSVLDEATRSAVRHVLEADGATNIRVFGSTALGTDRPGSDLDIIARFPSNTDLFDVMRMEAEIERMTGISVDIVPDDPRTAWALKEAKAEAVPL